MIRGGLRIGGAKACERLSRAICPATAIGEKARTAGEPTDPLQHKSVLYKTVKDRDGDHLTIMSWHCWDKVGGNGGPHSLWAM